jgi:hypothetical protein
MDTLESIPGLLKRLQIRAQQRTLVFFISLGGVQSENYTHNTCMNIHTENPIFHIRSGCSDLSDGALHSFGFE